MGSAGPTDPQVGVAGVSDLKGGLLGCVVNFSCHATASPGGISANWIGAMEQALRKATGDASLPVVFVQGAGGDVTQVELFIRRCMGFAKRWDYGALCMVNVFVFRATNSAFVGGAATWPGLKTMIFRAH